MNLQLIAKIEEATLRTAYLKKKKWPAKFIKSVVVCNLSKSFLVVAIVV